MDEAGLLLSGRGGGADATSLLRYAPLLDDVDAFIEASTRPLPKVVWANPLQGDVEETRRLLEARCPDLEPVGWTPNAWRMPVEVQPGAWIEHLLGRFYAQEEAAMWAGLLVEARPGERILDMCASPGGKTAQIAIAMEDSGTLIANERSWGRLSALRRTLDRLGITCAGVHHADGAALKLEEGSFDRVLVDAPCSCEGNRPKFDAYSPEEQRRFRDSISQVQRGLLRKALKLVKVGGSVVYSTCTYAPEENEATLSAVSAELAEIAPIEAPEGLRVSPGVTSWEGRDYRPDVVHAARLWPHHNDTGGFFAARLIRRA